MDGWINECDILLVVFVFYLPQVLCILQLHLRHVIDILKGRVELEASFCTYIHIHTHAVQSHQWVDE